MENGLQSAVSALEAFTAGFLAGGAASENDAEALARLLRLTVRLCAAHASPALRSDLAIAGEAMTPTEVAIVVNRLLDAVEMDAFELAMWRSWGTR